MHRWEYNFCSQVPQRNYDGNHGICLREFFLTNEVQSSFSLINSYKPVERS